MPHGEPHQYNLDQIKEMFENAFAIGCTKPVGDGVIAKAYDLCEKPVTDNWTAGEFEKRAVRQRAARCCTICGQIATLAADARHGDTVQVEDFQAAFDLLKDHTAKALRQADLESFGAVCG